MAELLVETLAEAGYDVAFVRDGLAALDWLRGHPVDLLVVDINMPRLGGASLVQRLRTAPEWERCRGLPVVAISALWDVVTFDLDVQAGLPKPIDLAVLSAKVRELIGPP